MNKVKTYKTLQALVYENLRDAILSGRLEPGSRLVAERIAHELGVSRMPVRESLRRLESEGLVTRIPHKEAVVRQLSLDEIEDIYAIRLQLEGYGGRLAARNCSSGELEVLVQLADNAEAAARAGDWAGQQEANRRFHEGVFRASGSPVLFEILVNLWNRCSVYRHWAAKFGNRVEESLEEHRAIIEALGQGDESLVERLVREHTRKAITPLLNHLQAELKVQEERED
ncbi:MAG: GntR family transcriptional regulator [Limnochordia bacterium]